MDERAMARVVEDLVDWGILEREPELQPTRRFRGAIMRAAALLQEEERAGSKRPGHPIEVSVAVALQNYPLPPGAIATREHHQVLVGLQLASLPENVRALLGV